MKKWGFVLAVLVLASLIGVAVFSNRQPAPPFQLIDLNGQTVTEQSLQGKVTLINFWYPSCPGCVVEMPKLIATQQKFSGKPYQTLAISLPYNTEAEVRHYVTSRQLPFTVMIDRDGAVGKRYNVQLAPNSFLVNKQGQILKSYVGEPDWDELNSLIEQALAP